MPEMNAQDRLVAIVELLAKSGRDGMHNKAVVTALKQTAATISRDLSFLEAATWVERTTAGAARLTPHFGGIANQIARSFNVARLRLNEDQSRYASAMQ